MPPCSPNPDPISDPKNVIFNTRFQTRSLKSIAVFRPGLSAEIMASLIRFKFRVKAPSMTRGYNVFNCTCGRNAPFLDKALSQVRLGIHF